MNRTRKNIAISVIPIHQFFFIRNRFGVEAVVIGAGCDVGTDSGWLGILNCARFRIGFTLGWLQP
jgi:hypothetical protein